jgi:hypothetical protein
MSDEKVHKAIEVANISQDCDGSWFIPDISEINTILYQ